MEQITQPISFEIDTTDWLTDQKAPGVSFPSDFVEKSHSENKEDHYREDLSK